MKFFLQILILLALGSAGFGKEIFVDYALGKKGNSGTQESPLPDFASGLRRLQPGDTLKILPSKEPIRDLLHIGELRGTQEKPIVIDGSFNIFDGAVPLNSKEWKEVSPGLFRRQRELASNMAVRYYMIHKGRGVFMGRATKSVKNPPFKKPEELQPGEWTIVDPEPKNRQKHEIEFYLRLAEGEKTPADGAWEEPFRISGVHIAASCTQKTCGHSRCGEECGHVHLEHVIFRNIIVRHYWNDGFNIHGKAKSVAFENIAAVECGDDGLSAHESVELTAKNFVSVGCSTGICHIQNVTSTQTDVYIEGTRGVDFYPCDKTKTVLQNTFILGKSPKGVVLNVTEPGSVEIANSVFLNTNPRAGFVLSGKNPVQGTFRDVRISGYKKAVTAPGLESLNTAGELQETVAEKRASFFRIFQGKLEQACGQ